jgi:hypothetical protein
LTGRLDRFLIERQVVMPPREHHNQSRLDYAPLNACFRVQSAENPVAAGIVRCGSENGYRSDKPVATSNSAMACGALSTMETAEAFPARADAILERQGRAVWRISLPGRREAFNISLNSLPRIRNLLGIKGALQLVGVQNTINNVIHRKIPGARCTITAVRHFGFPPSIPWNASHGPEPAPGFWG